MEPLVSILIPAYNAQEWICEAVHSALEQSWARKEIIIVNDGSTDGTLAVAKAFASADVKVVTQENQGAAAARNKAFSLCQGDYIQWLDADDLLAPDKIARQIAAARQCASPRTLISSAWGSFFYRVSKAKFVPSALWANLSPVDWLLMKFEHGAYMPTTTWLVSRELTNAAGPWDTRLLSDDDGEYFFRVIEAGNGVRFVSEAKTFYRVSGINRLSYLGRSDKKFDAQFLGIKLQIEMFRAYLDNEQVRAACLSYLRNCLIQFYPHRLDLVESMQQLAKELGGQLAVPSLSWKYRWLEMILGLTRTRGLQLNYNARKVSVLQRWDRAMSRMERRNLRSNRNRGNPLARKLIN